ncbi:MAG: RidA family protein, partial [Acidobacteria bacterium]|nr:RidA family protein [Acidobacteriota bacterium]
MTNRRKMLTGVTGVAAAAAAAQAQTGPEKKVHRRGPKPKQAPLFNGAVSHGNLLF